MVMNEDVTAIIFLRGACLCLCDVPETYGNQYDRPDPDGYFDGVGSEWYPVTDTLPMMFHEWQ